MRRSMSAKRCYPPVVWVGWIAAAPVGGDPVVELVAGACWVDVCCVGAVDCDAGGVDCEAVVAVWTGGEVVAPVVEPPAVGVVPAVDVAAVDVAAVVEAVVDVEATVVEVVAVEAAGGGAGAPGAGGSVEVPGPVTSAPFFAVIATNAAASGVWMLPSAPATLPPGPATRYPTAPGGGSTIPMPPARRSMR